MDILQTQIGTPKDEFLQPLGQLFARMALASTDKGKHGQEGNDFTIAQIKCMFLEAVGAIVGRPVNFSSWSVTPESPASQQPTKIETAALASLHDHGSASWLAKQRGYEVGVVVVENILRGWRARFLIERIDDATSEITLRKAIQYSPSDKVTGKISLKEPLNHLEYLPKHADSL